MWDFNQFVFQGRVTRDAELKETPGGKKYCRFSVANNSAKRKADGSYAEICNFFNLVIFDEYAARNVEKLWCGRRLLIIGKVYQDKWIDEKGGKHDELKIKIDRMLFDPVSKDEREKHIGVSGPSQTQCVPVSVDNETDTNFEEAIPVFEMDDSASFDYEEVF